MLEFNGWFFVLLANFLVLLFVLNIILFKPLLALFEKREASTKGFMDEARKMGQTKEDAIAEMKARFGEAGKKARAEFDSRRNEGIENQRGQMAEAGKEASSMIEKARIEIGYDAGKARKAMAEEVEKLSVEISAKVAGV